MVHCRVGFEGDAYPGAFHGISCARQIGDFNIELFMVHVAVKGGPFHAYFHAPGVMVAAFQPVMMILQGLHSSYAVVCYFAGIYVRRQLYPLNL